MRRSKQLLIFLPYETRKVGDIKLYRSRRTIQCKELGLTAGVAVYHSADNSHAVRFWCSYADYSNGDYTDEGFYCDTEAEARAALDKIIVDEGHIIVDSEEEADKYRLLRSAQDTRVLV